MLAFVDTSSGFPKWWHPFSLPQAGCEISRYPVISAKLKVDFFKDEYIIYASVLIFSIFLERRFLVGQELPPILFFF